MSADPHGIQALDAERAALTLPGDISGLLRRGSPVTHIDGSRLVVVEMDGGDAKLPSGWAYTRLLDLDLTDATGRAHAAWWAKTAADELYGDQYRMSPDAARILRLAQSGAEMPVKLILDLRNLCLHVAGLEVTP